MAFTITCPSCSAKLKTAAAIPTGRSVQCPKCKSSFAVSNDNMAESADSKMEMPSTGSRSTTTKAAAAPARRPAAAASDEGGNPFGGLDDGPPRSKRRDDDDDRPRSRRRDDDEDDRPRKRRDDDEDDRPRSRRRDEEDDRPRSRRRDEDEDDRPRKRRDEDDEDRPRKRRDDEDDDRPRSRRRDDDDDRPSRNRDDDDDDDRPRRFKKKKKRKKGGAAILIISAVSLLLLVGGGILLYFLFFSGGYDEEMVALMPSDVYDLDFEDVAKLMDHPKAKKKYDKMLEGSPLKAAGLSPSDIKSRMVGHTEKSGNVTVYRLKSSFDKSKLTSGTEEAKAGDKQYWKLGKKNDFARSFASFPADDLILLTANEDTMKSILNKESGKIVISEQLQDLASKVSDGDIWSAHVNKNPGGGLNLEGVDEGVKALMKAKATGQRLSISGNTLTISSYTIYPNSDDAKKAADHMKANKDKDLEHLDKAPGLNEAQKEAIRKMRQSASISQSGDTVEGSASLDLTPFDDGDKAFFF